MDRSVCKQFFSCGAGAQPCFSFAGEKLPDLRSWICFDSGNFSLGNHMTTFCACLRAHFYDPIGFFQNLRVVVYQNDGISVCYQIVHDPGQSYNVGWVQTDGRLIEHIENTCCTVTDSAGQLHPLALTSRERRSRAVQRQIAQSEVHQALGRALERLTNTFGHRAHFFRQTSRYPPHPLCQPGQRHSAGFIRNAPQLRGTGGIGKACAVAIRANVLFQKLFHPLHALFRP